jgi:two-component system response regulator AlgR
MGQQRALRALVVDDEALAVRRLTRSLERIAGVGVVAATTSARQALTMIAEEKPDLVFVDIAMPGLSGFELVERIAPAERPAIVFVTAFDAYAVQAFDVAAVDYLLKPVGPERLEEAVYRARLWLQARSADPVPTAADGPAWIDSLWIQRHREFVRMPLDEVAWIEAERDYAHIHGRRFSGLARTTLTALAGRLDPRRFVRVHRSAICRKAAIVSLRRKSTGAVTVLLDNGDAAPVGRTFIPGVRALLREMER